MKEKLVFLFFIFIFSFTLILKPEFVQANNDSTLTEDYREMMKDVKEKVKNDEKESIENLESVKKFKSKYSDEEIEEYVKNTEAMKFKNSKKSNENDKVLLEVGDNEEKMLEFDDGSFIVAKSETVPVLNVSTFTNNHEGKHGNSYMHTITQDFWGIYKTMTAKLRTHYTVYKTYINIYDVDSAGTKASIGFSYTNNGTSAVVNRAKAVQSKFSFTKYTLGSVQGFPLGWSQNYTLRTYLEITKVSANGPTVKWKSRSVLQ